MKKPSKAAKTTKRQRAEYLEAAHMVKADHDEVAFEKRLKKIVKEKPKTKASRKMKARPKKRYAR